MSQQLYAAAPEPKQLVLISGAGHDVAEVAGSQYFQAVQKFVQQVLVRRTQLFTCLSKVPAAFSACQSNVVRCCRKCANVSYQHRAEDVERRWMREC